jgi:hypothetical protein
MRHARFDRRRAVESHASGRGRGAGSLALGGGYLWVIVGPLTYPGDNRITQVSLSSSEPVRSWQLKGDTVSIAFGDGAAWVGTNYAGVGLLNVIRPGRSDRNPSASGPATCRCR